MKYLTSVIAVLLAIGCFSLPIGYYMFLRLVACGGAAATVPHINIANGANNQ